MKAIGRAANFLVGVVETIVVGILTVIGFVIGVICIVYGFHECWSLIDGAHLGTLKSIAGIVGLILVAVVTLSVIGEMLDPFDFMNFTGGEEGARKATRDDLRKAGLIRRR
jgi:hypothetical protein